LVVASQNKNLFKLFELNRKIKIIKINPNDISAMIHLKNSKIQKEEFYWGSSFLSQSARFIAIGKNVSAIDIAEQFGEDEEDFVLNKFIEIPRK